MRDEDGPSRREFIQAAAGGAAVLCAGGCSMSRVRFDGAAAGVQGPFDTSQWPSLAQLAISRFQSGGCSYGDVRLLESRNQAVRAQGDAIVTALVNAAVLSGYASGEIRTGSMTREYEDGRADHVIMVPAAQLTLTGHAATVRAEGNDGPSLCEELTELLRSVNDDNVAQALRLLKTHPEDWTQLCNIVEIVKDNIGAAVPTDWASRNILRRLSRTAQHSETAGDTARHVRHPSEPSETPMPISEAQTVIRSLLIHWVRNMAADT